jgi:hypothetical protein
MTTTTGDKSAQSYGWLKRLDEAVPEGGSVTIATPGFDTRYTDTRYPDVTVGGKTYRAGKGEIETVFDAAAPSVAVTNQTGAEWPIDEAIYVFCPHLLAEGANEWDLKGQIWDLQQRVLALEGAAKST